MCIRLAGLCVPLSLFVGLNLPCGLAAASLSPATSLAETSARPSTNLPCSVLTRLLLSEMGVTAKALAAVGADGITTQTIVTVARAQCEARSVGFDAAFAEYEAAAGEVRRLEDLVITGRAAPEDRAALEQARVDLATAEQFKAILREQVQAVIDSTLDRGQASMLANIVAARHIAVPVEYKVQVLSEQDWVALRDGLVRANDGLMVPADGAPTVGDPGDVQQARNAITANLVEVVAAWDQALGG